MIAAWVAAALFAAVAAEDIVWRRIGDGWIVALLLTWGAGAAAQAMPWTSALAHVGTGVLAFMVLWASFALGWVGGGDVKLGAAVFLWSGPVHGVPILALVAGAGIPLCLICLAAGRLVRLPLPRGVRAAVGTLSSERGIPYGVALSIGGAMAALSSLSGGS